jgi:hypothetical protein
MRPEPWLRGPLADVHPLVAPILYAFQQAREDLATYTEGLTAQQIWNSPHGFASAGFHIRHIAGSTDRLMTYLRGGELTESQFAELRDEGRPLNIDRQELLTILENSLATAERAVRAVDPRTLAEPRTIGRQRLPTTVIGLITHIAEHTQRHIGQAISACKWARVTG